jgi:hypothetical protein
MKFFSKKYSELILTVDPKTFSVESGFRVTKGMMGIGQSMGYPQGLSITFLNGEFNTKSLNLTQQQELRLIDVLKKHPSYGVSYVAEDYEKEHDNADREKQVQQEKKEAAQKAADTDHKEPVNKPKK